MKINQNPPCLLKWWDFIWLPLAAFGLTSLILYQLLIKHSLFPLFMENYRAALRGSFFTGFLSLGSLLWAVKSFIISNLKKDYFEKQLENIEFIKQMRSLSRGNDVEYDYSSYFYPLVNLSRSLFLSIVFSLATAVIQVVIGSIKNIYATIFACGNIAFTVTLLSITLYFVNKNYSVWMDDSTKNYNKKIKESINKLNNGD